MVIIPEESMPQSLLVSILGAMHALYTNIELREAVPEKAQKAEALGIWSSCAKQMQVRIFVLVFERNPSNFRRYHLQSS